MTESVWLVNLGTWDGLFTDWTVQSNVDNTRWPTYQGQQNGITWADGTALNELNRRALELELPDASPLTGNGTLLAVKRMDNPGRAVRKDAPWGNTGEHFSESLHGINNNQLREQSGLPIPPRSRDPFHLQDITERHFIAVRVSGTRWQMWFNDDEIADEQISGGVCFRRSSTATVGSLAERTKAVMAAWWVTSAIHLVPRALSDEELQQARDFLRRKWAGGPLSPVPR